MNNPLRFHSLTTVIGALCCVAMLISPAWAQNPIDRCNDVLKQDLKDKASGRSEQAQSAQEALTETFFSQDSDDAYKEYSNAYDNGVKEKDSGHIEANGAGFGGAAGFAHSYDHKLTKDEFA